MADANSVSPALATLGGSGWVTTGDPRYAGGTLGGVPSASIAATQSLRQIATASRIPTTFSSVNKQSMSRSAHWMRTSLPSFKLVYANWMGDNVNGETGTGAPVTFTASVEYPVGVFTRVTFNGGATSVTLADLASVVSDDVVLTIAKGDKFFVRTYCAGTGGILYWNKSISTTVHGEAMAFGASGVADQTMSGTVVDGGNAGLVSPAAIVGYTNQPAPYLLGDSRVAGLNDTYTGCTFNDQGELARSIGPFMGYINGGVPAENAQQLATASTRMARRIALAKAYCTHVICNLGINDVGSARTAAQAYADLQTVWGYFANLPILQATIAPYTTSTDAWATTVNQTPQSGNANRVALNNLIRGSALPSGVIEIADAVESARDSGFWAVPGYTTDGLHESQKACIAIQNSGKLFPGRLTW